MADFQEIEVYSNWCYYDRLAGKDLHHGEHLEVQWPDGTTEKVRIEINERGVTVNDHGHSARLPIREAYFRKKVHGQDISVYFKRGALKARRMGAERGVHK